MKLYSNFLKAPFSSRPNEFARRIIKELKVSCQLCGAQIARGDLCDHNEKYCPRLKEINPINEEIPPQQSLVSSPIQIKEEYAFPVFIFKFQCLIS